MPVNSYCTHENHPRTHPSLLGGGVLFVFNSRRMASSVSFLGVYIHCYVMWQVDGGVRFDVASLACVFVC